MTNLCIRIFFPVSRDDSSGIRIETNTKSDAVDDLLGEFLRTQIGTGEDDSEPNRLDIYEITLSLDLSDDSWRVRHDCGNEGLRDGIIMAIRQEIGKRGIDSILLTHVESFELNSEPESP